MNSALFTVPLKPNSLEKFKDIINHTFEHKSDEWRDMLSRYDLSSVKIWCKHFDGVDYAFVYHDAGDAFEEKLKGWDESTHPFDIWFNDQLMSVYDVANIEGMQAPEHLLDLYV